jgi:hypothetical protein
MSPLASGLNHQRTLVAQALFKRSDNGYMPTLSGEADLRAEPPAPGAEQINHVPESKAVWSARQNKWN